MAKVPAFQLAEKVACFWPLGTLTANERAWPTRKREALRRTVLVMSGPREDHAAPAAGRVDEDLGGRAAQPAGVLGHDR